MKDKSEEVEEAVEEEEMVKAPVEVEVDMEIEILRLPDLMQKETHTLMTLDQKEEEMPEEESMKDSIEKMVPEEPVEVVCQEKETIELMSVMMEQTMPKLKNKKFKKLNQ